MTPRVLVITIALIMLFCLLANDIEHHLSNTYDYAGACMDGMHFALYFWLGIALIRGSRVARWVVVVLLAIYGFYLLNKGEALTDPDSLWGLTYYYEGVLSIITGSLYSACAIALLTPYAGRHFVKSVVDEQDKVNPAQNEAI